MNINCDVYLINYKPLTERLAFMQRQLDDRKISYAVISDEPPSSWARDDINIRSSKMKSFSANYANSMTKSEISLAWKHLVFLKYASSSERKSLVLEDDAILSDNFVEVINKIVSEDFWDVVFPGSGCNLRCKGDGLVRVPHPASKCTDSYLVTAAAASSLYNALKDAIDFAIDWELNYQMMHHDLDVYWYEPPIVRQGSQDGSFRSSISGKIENVYR